MPPPPTHTFECVTVYHGRRSMTGGFEFDISWVYYIMRWGSTFHGSFTHNVKREGFNILWLKGQNTMGREVHILYMYNVCRWLDNP